METPQDEVTFAFRISRIKDLEFFIDESVELDDQNNSSVTFNSTIDVNLEQNSISIVIEPSFYLDDISNTFMRGKVLTTFAVLDMKQFLVEEDKINIPDQGIATMLSIAITHARALIAKASMGSKFNDLYVPIVDPMVLAQNLKAHMPSLPHN